jgi:hypothetical protein
MLSVFLNPIVYLKIIFIYNSTVEDSSNAVRSWLECKPIPL